MDFPADFLLGAATAAHQVEGNNIHSDCWAMEQMLFSAYAEPSLDAADHYHRYEDDIRLLADAGLNCYRFSIEWARIEPEKGAFDLEEVAHYREVLLCCHRHGVTPIVTLHHFSSPAWLIREGGWEAAATVDHFRRYCAFVAQQLGDLMEYVVTINEANMGLQLAAIAQQYAKKLHTAQIGIDLETMRKNAQLAAEENRRVFGTAAPCPFLSPRTPEGDRLIMDAHVAARDAMKLLCPHLKVGLSLSLHDIQALPGGEALARAAWDTEFRHYLPYIQGDDFLGIQNYTRSRYDAQGQLSPPANAELTQMQYEFCPEALEKVLRAVHRDFPGDLLVTENGVATSDDDRRTAFIDTALSGVKKCIGDGIPVKAYCHWSLLDNFEWQKGYAMTFGLIAVDRVTQTRHPKQSLYHLGLLRHHSRQ